MGARANKALTMSPHATYRYVVAQRVAHVEGTRRTASSSWQSWLELSRQLQFWPLAQDTWQTVSTWAAQCYGPPTAALTGCRSNCKPVTPCSYTPANCRYYGYYLGVYGTYGSYDMDFRKSFAD